MLSSARRDAPVVCPRRCLSSTPGPDAGQALDTAACRFGARDALISLHQNLRYSYAELLHEVNRAAKALIASGCSAVNRVGIWSPNNAEWAITQYAAAKRAPSWSTSIRLIGPGNYSMG